MMRETKIGLVVAGAFLSCAGGFFGLRMYQNRIDTTATTNEVTESDPPTPVVQVAATPPAVVPPDNPQAQPNVAPLPQPNVAPLPQPTVATQPLVPPSTPQVPAAPEFKPVPTPTAVVVDQPKANAEALPAPVDLPKVPDANKLASTVDAPPVPDAGKPTLPVETPKPIETPRIVENAGPPPAPAESPKPPAAENLLPPPNDLPKPNDSPPPPLVEAPKVPANVPPTPPTESPKPVDSTPAAPIASPPVVEAPKVVDVPPPPPKASETAPPTPANAALTTVPGTLNAPIRAEGGAPRPLSEVSLAGGSPVVPLPKQPASDSFLEEEYRTQAGDNFTGISRRFLNSERYANALQQYNRDYPIASPNLRSDPPRLGNGQIVWIPPIRVLERRYPHLVPGLNSTNKESTPTWNSANAASTPSYKTYRVRESNGETMAEIARQTLGSPNRWNEVYRLNPNLNPSFTVPIPAGSLLKLPADAKVE